MSKIVTISIDRKKIEVNNNLTVIQACEKAGVQIPRFCYHEGLKIAGNCRMCLVNIGDRKLVPSCVEIVNDGMEIDTKSKNIQDARKGILEFLLINHPLDCPICDRGGECELQDQVMEYGPAASRYKEDKRAVSEKELGPLVQTYMTRCIHCTRCVRFMEDIAGVPELGITGRGENTEITVVGESLTSEFSGNIIDLCPVGALTAKPYQAEYRSWELNRVPTIDILDAMASHIYADIRGNRLMRVLPRYSSENQGWISDKTRFAYDGLAYQRIGSVYMKCGRNLKESTFLECFSSIKSHLVGNKRIGFLTGDLTDINTMWMAKKFANALGSTWYDCRQDGSSIRDDFPITYLFNNKISDLEKADTLLIIGSDVRHEASILNLRIREAVLNGLKVALIGEEVDLTYDYEFLGDSVWILDQLCQGKHPYINKLKKAKNPMIILGSTILCRQDGDNILNSVLFLSKKFGILKENWYGFNLLNRSISRVGGLCVGFIPEDVNISYRKILRSSDILFTFGIEDTSYIPDDTYVICFAHHFSQLSDRADIVIPVPTGMEKESLYMNIMGELVETSKVISPPGSAKEEYKIIIELMKYLNLDPERWEKDEITKFISNKICNEDIPEKISYKRGYFVDEKINNPKINYYLADHISRNSPTMAKCNISRGLKDQKKK